MEHSNSWRTCPRRRSPPKSVYGEVVIEGKEKGASDALIVERAVDEEIVEVKETENKEFLQNLLGVSGLHEADAEVLTLAREVEGTAIVDDEKARSIADLKDIPNRGTAYLLVKLQKLELPSKEEVRRKLDKMISLGWRCSTEVYAEILKSIGI